VVQGRVPTVTSPHECLAILSPFFAIYSPCSAIYLCHILTLNSLRCYRSTSLPWAALHGLTHCRATITLFLLTQFSYLVGEISSVWTIHVPLHFHIQFRMRPSRSTRVKEKQLGILSGLHSTYKPNWGELWACQPTNLVYFCFYWSLFSKNK
jgi:hypothetical protein